MKPISWKDVEEAQDFARPTAGGYICRIAKVEDVPEKEYLIVRLDIAEGEFANFASNAEVATGQDWSYLRSYWSYKETAKRMFAHNLGMLERSNPGKFTKNGFDNDEQKLCGLLIGAVLREEEYEKDGQVKLALRVDKLHEVQDIKDGKFKVPPMKELTQNMQSEPKKDEVDDTELPF